jgi:hypothetical protein
VNDSHLTIEENLDWLAFQYVSGELSEHDSVVFEEQLAKDPASCEAVARQVMIFESVVLLTSTAPEASRNLLAVPHATPPAQTVAARPAARVSRTDRSTQSSSARWVGVVITAACLAIVVWAGSSVSPKPQSLAVLDTQPGSRLTASDELLGYWVDIKQDLDQPSDMLNLLSVQGDELWELSSDDADIAGEFVPGWMLAAVSKNDMVGELMPEETRE